MNYLEFKRQLMVEPGSDDAAFMRAREADQRHREAYAQAMAFEADLQRAAQIAVPDDLLQLCMNKVFAATSDHSISDQPTAAAIRQQRQQRQRWAWLPAMAAGLVMGIGLTTAAFMLQRVTDNSIDDYLASHWQHDGPEVISHSALAPMNAENIQRILATLNLDLNSEYADQFTYAKNCPTPKGLGVHLVVLSNHGPATVIYIPAHNDYDPARFNIDGMQAQLVPLQSGSVAILGNNQQVIDDTSVLLRKALRERPAIDA